VQLGRTCREIPRCRILEPPLIDKARTDPDTARHVLAMFTGPCMTLASFNRERDYLIGIGIPAEFLPAARAFGQVAFPDAGPETGSE